MDFKNTCNIDIFYTNFKSLIFLAITNTMMATLGLGPEDWPKPRPLNELVKICVNPLIGHLKSLEESQVRGFRGQLRH